MACPDQLPEYSEEHLQTLRGTDHVRLRPGMYISSTDSRGLSHLLFELATESLAEVTAGRGRSVRVTLRADGSAEVDDDGRPMPNVEQAFTNFNTEQRGDVDPYRIRTGLHDATYVVTNALSERLSVAARTDGSTYWHSFTRGVTHAVLQSGGPPKAQGMTVTFRPDPEIFGDARFDAEEIRDRLRQLAFLHSGARITITNEVAGTCDEFEYTDGIRECVASLNKGRRPLHADAIVLRGEEQGVRYEVGLQWCEEEEEMRQSFANHRATPDGGTHDRGLTSGVTTAVRDFIRKHAPHLGKFESDDLRTGLTAVVSVWLRNPYFEGATRSRLGNPEAETVVAAAVRRGVRDYFAANHEVAERVIRAVTAERDARETAKSERRKRR